MIENIKDIESSLNLKEGSLLEAFSNEENVTVDISGLKINTIEDHDTLILNTKKTQSKIAEEELLKKMKSDSGLEYEGRKDPSNFIKALTEKVSKDAGIEPEKKYTDLKTAFDKLQTNLTNSEDNYNKLVDKNNSEGVARDINGKITAAMPKDLKISNKDALLLFNANTTSYLNDSGVLEFTKDGDVLRNDTNQNPLTLDEVMTTFATPYLLDAEGGRGGKDDKGGKGSTSLDIFDKRMAEAGHGELSAEYSKEFDKAIADKTLIM